MSDEELSESAEEYRPIDAVNERLDRNLAEGARPKESPPPAKLPERVPVDGTPAEPWSADLQSEKAADLPVQNNRAEAVLRLNESTPEPSEWGPLNRDNNSVVAPQSRATEIDLNPLIDVVKAMSDQIKGLRDDLAKQKPADPVQSQVNPPAQTQVNPVGQSPAPETDYQPQIPQGRIRRPRGWLKKSRRKNRSISSQGGTMSGYSPAVVPEKPEPVLPKVQSAPMASQSSPEGAKLPEQQRATGPEPAVLQPQKSESRPAKVQGSQPAPERQQAQTPVQQAQMPVPAAPQQHGGQSVQQDPVSEAQKSVQSMQAAMLGAMKSLEKCVSIIQQVASMSDENTRKISQLDSQLQSLMQFTQSTRQRSMKNGTR